MRLIDELLARSYRTAAGRGRPGYYVDGRSEAASCGEREVEVSIKLPGFSITFFHAYETETVEPAPGVVGMNEIAHNWDQS